MSYLELLLPFRLIYFWRLLLCCLLFSVFLLLPQNSVSQTLKADVDKACVNTPLVLNVSGFSSDVKGVDYYYRTSDNGKWNRVGTSVYGKNYGIYVTPMLDVSEMRFIAVRNGEDVASATVKTNEAIVKKTTDCPKECHLTSTGDYFNGTDFNFNISAGQSSGKPKIPEDIVTYFEEYDMGFESNNSDYEITNKVEDYLGQKPSLDKEENFYYVYTGNNTPGHLFVYKFPHQVYTGKHYRMVMRLYLKLNGNCKSCDFSNTKIKMETGYGNQATEWAEGRVYDDETGDLLETLLSGGTFGALELRSLKGYGCDKLFRIEITYYGIFPTTNVHDGQYWDFKPLFQQFPSSSCYKLAIDYISADVESVCMTSDAICVGGSACKDVNAAGFPYDAVYHWEEQQKDGSWKTYEDGGIKFKGKDFSTVCIKSKSVGKVNYRVSDASNSEFKPISFFVSGENCGPVEISEINGDRTVCLPTLSNTYSVDPKDSDESVYYVWKLYSPDGDEISGLKFDNKDILDQKTPKGDIVTLSIPRQYGEGKYKLVAYPVKKFDNGVQEYEKKEILIDAIMTPQIRLELQGYSGDVPETDKVLCSSNKNHKIIARTSLDHTNATYEYKYEWDPATAVPLSGDGSSARIEMGDDVCDIAKDKTYTVGVKTTVVAGSFTGCPAYDKATYKVKTEPSVMDCDMLGVQTIELEETQKDTLLEIKYIKYFPNISGCDPNPVVEMSLAGEAFKMPLNSFLETRDLSTSMVYAGYNVTLPVGTHDLIYKVEDGCGRGNVCSTKVVVVDKNPPRVDCGSLPELTSYLSTQSACASVPGVGDFPVITAPVLTDLNGVDGDIKGVYVGRSKSPSAGGSIDKTVKLNDPYPVGESFIVWSFADLYGNKTECRQKVVVVDDKLPAVNCGDYEIGEIPSITDKCGLSVNAVLDQITEPTAVDVCSGNGVKLVPELYYKKKGDKDSIRVTSAEFNNLIFDVDVEYELIWVFKKVHNQSYYSYCKKSFTPKDKQAPDFDCSRIEDIRVLANNKDRDGKITWKRYASYSSKDASFTPTMKEFFNNGKIAIPPVPKDNCGGKLSFRMEVVGPDENGIIETEAVKDIDDLKNHRFYVGLSTINYIYADKDGNEAVCSQDIYVSMGETPQPNCNGKDVEIFVDEKCEAVFRFDLNAVPTASIPYEKIGRYYTLRHQCVGTPPSGVALCDWVGGKMQKDLCDASGNITDKWCNVGFGDNGVDLRNNPENFASCNGYYNENVLSSSNSLSGVSFIQGYPYEVEIRDADGKSVFVQRNKYTASDTIWLHTIAPRYYPENSGSNYIACAELEKPCKVRQVMRTNFLSIPDVKLTAGEYSLVWKFENEENGEERDSCVYVIKVVDNIKPVIDCKDFADIAAAADDKCEADLGLALPDASAFYATDNCTSVDDLVVSFKRTYKGAVVKDLSAPFGLGQTEIVWGVTDKGGNSASCPQNIVVTDQTGPVFDCSSLDTVKAFAGTDCMVTVADIVKAGLIVPKADDDVCSPTGSRITAVGLRSDGNLVKEVNGKLETTPFPLGVTVITWTFTDGAGNETSCQQAVLVEDNSSPVFVECNNLPDIVFELSAEECFVPLDQVKVKLGSHKATDNCEGDVDGVPYVQTKKGREELYSEFKKDTMFTIAWVFSDGKNEEVCFQDLFVKDTAAPNTIGVCPDPTKTVNATVTCDVLFSDLNLPSLVVDDKCDGELPGVLTGEVLYYSDGKKKYETYGEEELKDLSYPVGTHYFTWTFTDKAGLSSQCKLELTVADAIKPKDACAGMPTDTIVISVSDNLCATKPEEVTSKFVLPTVVDECDSLIAGSNWRPIIPIVKRFRNGALETTPEGAALDVLTWDKYPFELGITEIQFIYIDNSMNKDTCRVFVSIEDHTAPVFDCDSINPNPIKPVAASGCVVNFDEITFGEYYAKDNCSSDLIKGYLAADDNNTLDVNKLTFAVGDTITLNWYFVDKDNNKKKCPQVIIPMHKNPVNFDCKSLAKVEKKAKEGACFLSADELNLDTPVGQDTCVRDTLIKGFATRSDSLLITDDFPTGLTSVYWHFVSPYNIADTLKCEQQVVILGNNGFDFECDTLVPILRDTISDCGLSDGRIAVKVPVVPDPCANKDSSYYWRSGVGVRSDSEDLFAPYPLGTTVITWTFTDFTGSVTKVCTQDVVVKTSMVLDVPCDDLSADTIKRSVEEGKCGISSGEIMPVSVPSVKNPCTGDEIKAEGYIVLGSVNKPIADLVAADSFFLGITKVMWVFEDVSGLLANPVDTCYQNIQVGDSNQLPVDCRNMKDTTVNLIMDDCGISADELALSAPQVIDLCSQKVIVPDTVRSSGRMMKEDYFVGVDTVIWSYQFGNQLISCSQVITVKDSMAPDFDCSKLDTLRLASLPGLCYTDSSVVNAALGEHFAEEVCTKVKIKGVPTDTLGRKLPNRYFVGDTVLVKWTFADSVINNVARVCFQPIIVTGDHAPVFNCDSLKLIEVSSESECVYVPAVADISIPVAKDYCTGSDVPAKGYRLDSLGVQHELYSAYPLGVSEIMWVFDSPFSSVADTCFQKIHVKTSQDMIFDCESLMNDTIFIDVENGFCFVPFDSVKINPLYALHPCSGDTINGVKKRSDGASFVSPYKLGETKIEWTFTDTTETLLKPVLNCFQVVVVSDINKPIVDCKEYPDVSVVLDEGDCFISASDLNVESTVKPVLDLCSGDEYEPEHPLTHVKGPFRTSGKSMTDNYDLGTDTIVYYYNFTMRQPVSCRQVISVKDKVEPVFDCNTIEPEKKVVADKDECFVDSAAVDNALPKPFATVKCIDTLRINASYKLFRTNGDEVSWSGGDKLAVGDTFKVVWTFIDTLVNTVPKICETNIVVVGQNAPVFNCDSLNKTPIVAYTEDCVLNMSEDSLIAPVAKDFCTKTDVVGRGRRLDGGDLYGSYPLGFTMVRWYFESPYSIAIDSCDQRVHVINDKLGLDLHCDTDIEGKGIKDTIIAEIEFGECSVPASKLDLRAPFAVNPCTGDTVVAVGKRPNGASINDAYFTSTLIYWIFTDSSQTLLNNVDTCYQFVKVGENDKPIVDCNYMNDTVVYLGDNNCSVDASVINLTVPDVFDPCDVRVPKVPVAPAVNRTSAKALSDAYSVGSDTVVWKYEIQGVVFACDKVVTVLDTVSPKVKCLPATSDSIVVTLFAGSSVTADSVKLLGLVEPEVEFECSGVSITMVRSDAKPASADYGFGVTGVKWMVKDESGNVDSSCVKYVVVNDMVPPYIVCPPKDRLEYLGDTFSCTREVPVALTEKDFSVYGGYVNDSSKIKLGTFGFEDSFSGSACDGMSFKRTYYVYDLSGRKITCDHEFFVKDTIAPVLSIRSSNIKLSCSDEVPAVPSDIIATDNCGDTLDVYFDEKNTRSSDIASCEYYNYSIIRKWWAIDSCGNVSDTAMQVITIVDDKAPVVSLPDNWNDFTVANVLKYCYFTAPDVTTALADSVYDNCSGKDGIMIVQEPAAGDTVRASMDIKITISDLCGNDTVVYKRLYVPTRKSIVSLTGNDYSSCVSADDPISLRNKRITTASGSLYLEDYDGTYVEVYSTIFWDVYKDSISAETRLYGDNPVTSGKQCGRVSASECDSIKSSVSNIMLTRKSQSGKYFFVGMDTISFCTDTVSVNVTLFERPRVGLDNGTITVCENDKFLSGGMSDEYLSKFNVCVDNMGSEILDEGWILDDLRFMDEDTVRYTGRDRKLVYFAANECGVTTSMNSLFGSCHGSLASTADSLAVVGNRADLELWRQDALYVHDSVSVNVRQKMKPEKLMLVTHPSDKARVWRGEDATLELKTVYEPTAYMWYRVNGAFDGRFDSGYDKGGRLIGTPKFDEEDDLLAMTHRDDVDPYKFVIENASDSALYYVVITDGVCDAVASNVVSLDVMDKLPTAITPYKIDRMNDVFMLGYSVTIFNRYGQQVFSGDNGWDGRYRGNLADPGVYFFEVRMKDGRVEKGSVEVVSFK